MSELKPCRFTFDDSPEFEGFAHGSTWNGFDNVAVTREVLEQIVAWFRANYPNDEDAEEGHRDMLAIDADGERADISLSWGYCTQIVADQESMYDRMKKSTPGPAGRRGPASMEKVARQRCRSRPAERGHDSGRCPPDRMSSCLRAWTTTAFASEGRPRTLAEAKAPLHEQIEMPA